MRGSEQRRRAFVEVDVSRLGLGESERRLVRPADFLEQRAHHLPAFRPIRRDAEAGLQLDDRAIGEILIRQRLDVALFDRPVGRPEPRGETEPFQVYFAGLAVLQYDEALLRAGPEFGRVLDFCKSERAPAKSRVLINTAARLSRASGLSGSIFKARSSAARTASRWPSLSSSPPRLIHIRAESPPSAIVRVRKVRWSFQSKARKKVRTGNVRHQIVRQVSAIFAGQGRPEFQPNELSANAAARKRNALGK